ncbi:hypothetical protein AVEN_41438-1, partial [Araneus ventricosus]
GHLSYVWLVYAWAPFQCQLEAAETPNCSPGTSNTVSPVDISPVPNIKKRTTTRGRKATRSSLITGSPYKDQLTKSLEKSVPKNTSLSVPWWRTGQVARWQVGPLNIRQFGSPGYVSTKDLTDHIKKFIVWGELGIPVRCYGKELPDDLDIEYSLTDLHSHRVNSNVS